MRRFFHTLKAHLMYFFLGRVPIGIKYDIILHLRYATKEASCMDICCTSDTTIYPGDIKIVDLGFACDIPKGFELRVYLRSSMGKQGLVIPNSVGIIDSDYRGNIHLILGNISNKPIELNIGERIAQMGVYKVTRINLYETDTLTETERGKGGLGSTGK